MTGRCPYCSQPRSCPHGYRRKPDEGMGGCFIWPLFAILGGASALIGTAAHHLGAALAWAGDGLGLALLILMIIAISKSEEN